MVVIFETLETHSFRATLAYNKETTIPIGYFGWLF